MMQERFNRLLEVMGDIYDLGHAGAVLGWDQQTYMPARGAAGRARQMATLQKIIHSMAVSEEVGHLLEELEPWAEQFEYDSFERSVIRVTRKEYDQETRIPAKLVSDFAEARGLAVNAWLKAKADSDYATFRPHLERLVELAALQAEAIGYTDTPYDALLDSFEPDVKTSEVKPIFEQLKEGLVPLVREISRHPDRADDSPLSFEYPDAAQWAFSTEVLKVIGFDLERGRVDRAEHPFTTSFSANDVRLTTRIQLRHLGAGLFASIHEGGHGIYNQGFPAQYERTPLAGGASSGVHESQSRLWENVVGRSLPFWRFFHPRLRQMFPEQLAGIDAEKFYRAVNKVKPSLIRVEADEVTYNLHIFIRFELELEMIAGRLDMSRLPEIWGDKMEEYLGIRPANDAEGVLQDIHWASGLFGYFPTYTLGNVLSVQFFNQAVQDHPAIPDEMAAGSFDTLRLWMKTNIHELGRKFSPGELVKRVTGGPLTVGPYLQYIRDKYSAIYLR